MAWTESGLFTCTFRDKFIDLAAVRFDFKITTAKIALFNNTLVPDFTADPSSYATTNEVFGTGWAQGGVAVSAAAAGPASLAPTLAKSGDGKSVVFDATDLSVATTTLAAARGLIWYFDAATPKANGWGINFGGDYTTSAGTFAVTWSNSPVGIWVIKCVPSGA